MSGSRYPSLLRVLAALALSCGVVLLAGPAVSGGATSVLLGSGGPAEASCPEDCLVEARVTGFQTSIEGSKKPFVTPARGRIVSWSLDLGVPEKMQIKAFNKRFGVSAARLSILKPIRRKEGGRKKYVLLRQSPVQRLRKHFGATPNFPLERPLKVGQGHVVALTIPSWAPAFSTSQTDLSRWRASRAPTRKRGDCFTKGGFANLEAGAPHHKLQSERAYGCAFRGARLLYWATFVG
ncbi:MAG: hypothetical protein ACRDL6_09040 [Solirubrobacterales bacterium]